MAAVLGHRSAAIIQFPPADQIWPGSAYFEFRATQPAGGNESRQQQHRCGDDRKIWQSPGLCWNWRLDGGRAGQWPFRRPRGAVLPRGKVGWRGRHNDGLLTGGTIDLRPGIASVALDLLAALRAEEFEFSHKFYWVACWLMFPRAARLVNRLDFTGGETPGCKWRHDPHRP